MIHVEHLTKKYGNTTALHDISFTAKNGEVLALLGPNGAGKTTTMKILTGFLSPTKGIVEIAGKNIQQHAALLQRDIGYLPENSPLYSDLNVYEHLDFVAETHGVKGYEKKEAISRVAKMCNISDRLYHDVSHLSKGYRQRVGLAQALIHDPNILILDEPTTGLDPNQIIEIRQLIKKLGKEKTVILSTHLMQEVEAVCDRVIVIHHGEIVAEGTPGELTQKEKDEELTIRVVVRGSQKDVIATLENVKGVIQVKKDKVITRGVSSFLITAETDIRATVSHTLVTKKYDLLELVGQEEDLETVFQELTN